MYLRHKVTINMPYFLISVPWKHCMSFKRNLLKKTHFEKKNVLKVVFFFSSDVFFYLTKKQDMFFSVNTIISHFS